MTLNFNVPATFKFFVRKIYYVAEGVGVEPTDRFRSHGLANHLLNRSEYPPDGANFSRKLPHFHLAKVNPQTIFAPAFFKIAPQVLRVAPVVQMSSIRRI